MPGPTSPATSFAFRSDRGQLRPENEDAGFAGPLPGDDGWLLLLVADGLGGHRQGAWASSTAVETMVAALPTALADTEPGPALEAAITRANEVLNARGAQDDAYSGAATTVVAALVQGARFWWACVGDSRLYQLRGSELTQVSVDHSWVAEQVRLGHLTREAARTAPGRNVITRSVGFEAVVEVDTGGPISLEPGDRLLLCSDGLYGPITDDEIAAIASDQPVTEAAEALIAAANAAGGPDNITVALASFGEPTADLSPPPADPAPPADDARSRWRRLARLRWPK